MSALKKSYLPHVEIGGYNFRSSAFITKATAIAGLSGILAFINFVPPGTVF
jgi:hypothetical protein